MNYLKTGLLMVALAALLMGAGYLVGGPAAVLPMLIIALGLNFAMFWFSEKIALSMARAKPLGPNELPWLHKLNEEYSRRAGIPPARIHISPDPQPNAFACGRGPGHASICFNRGLIESMSEREVAGVLAHEIAHVKNRDVLTMTVVAAVATTITYLAYIAMFFGGGNGNRNLLVFLLLWLVAPVAAMLVQAAISRTREFAADETAAGLMQDPHPLADALENLGRSTKMVPSRTAQEATAHMYIASPLQLGGMSSLFSTHPPIGARVSRLRRMAAGAPQRL